MTMNAGDLESLANMLDKNRTFERPHGQSTGYSLQEHNAGGAVSHYNVVASSSTSQEHQQQQKNPAGIALPPTVVDHQLRLPQPSHGKAAEKKRQLAAAATAPHGDEIWTQGELKERFVKQMREGPAPVAAAARVMAAAQQTGAAAASTGSGPWRPSAEEAALTEEPAHTVLYQQNISAEDVYLGVDFTRDASSAASDGVTVRVELPRVTAASQIAMEVDPYELRVSVRGVYYLAAPLPCKVLRQAAGATWDGQKTVLTVRLKVDHSATEVKIVS